MRAVAAGRQSGCSSSLTSTHNCARLCVAVLARPPRRWLRLSIIWHVTFFVLFVLPVAVSAALYASSDHPRSFRDANWSSTGLLPTAASDPDARVTVFAARNGTWRGIFATHTWIVVKPRGGAYTRANSRR